MSNSMFPQYSTKKFTDIYDDVDTFVYDYKHIGIPYQINYVKNGSTVSAQTVNDVNIRTIYYLLYARYGNNPIANRDENQFKYKLFGVIYQYGPTWEKRLDVQAQLRGLTAEEIKLGSKAIYNQAMNPSTEPSTGYLGELPYINQQNTTNYKKGPLDGYALLLELLDTDVTKEFIDKFNICFKRFVSPENPIIFVSEDEEDDGD